MFHKNLRVPETKDDPWILFLVHICYLPLHDDRAPQWEHCCLNHMDHFVNIDPQHDLYRFHCYAPGTESVHEDREEEPDSSREVVFLVDMREKMENYFWPFWKTNISILETSWSWGFYCICILCHHFPHPLKTVCDTHQRIGRLRNSPEKWRYTIHLHQD